MVWLRDVDRWFMTEVLPHRPAHLAYALRLTGEPGGAEDAVQEVYARLFALEDWRRIERPHAFTMRAIHNLAVERFRRADVVQIEQALRLDLFDPADERPSPERDVIARAQLRQVAQMLDTLPARCREVVRLRRIEGLPPGQIAGKLGISVSTVEKHLARGLHLLTERLSALWRDEEELHSETWPKLHEKRTRS